MSQHVYLGLSLLGICTVVGAGVAVGSGVAMVASTAIEEQQKQSQAAAIAVNSPFERRVLSTSFAASADNRR